MSRTFFPRDLIAPFIAVALAVALLVGTLCFVAKRANDAGARHEEAIVANGFNVAMAKVADSAAAFVAHYDPSQTQTAAQIVESAFLVNQDGVAALAWRGLPRPENYQMFMDAASEPLASMRRTDDHLNGSLNGLPPHASIAAEIGGRVYILTATRLPHAGRARAAEVVIAATRIEAPLLNELSDQFLLDNLQLRAGAGPVANGRAHVLIYGPGGEPAGALEWWPEEPGAALLGSTLPPVLLLVGVLAIAGTFQYRRSRNAARELLASEARATHLAYHDALTGLPNRLLMSDRLGRAIEDLRRRNTPFAVHCIDLDHFKEVNDTFGHQAGDELIRAAARIISNACRSSDTIARLGGDEFAIVQIGADLAGAAHLADRIVSTLSQPIELAVGRVYIGASMGVSLFTGSPPEAIECLRQADLALYRAKEDGRGRYCFFEVEMDAAVRFRRAMKEELHEALSTKQLRLAYQPQVDGEGVIVGLEALVRWDHPQRGPVSPSVFVPLAEECGLIQKLGLFTLRQAFEDSRRWPGVKIGINISATQVRMRDFADQLAGLVEECKIDPSHFELEITEGVLLGDDPVTHDTLRRVRDLGFTLALDDFGTGYSSLSYLQRYPVDKIKIDRSFITNLGVDNEADAVVSAIVRLARALNLGVIAEGVETDDQRLRLRRAGCSEVQGYLFGKPSGPDVIDRLINNQPAPRARAEHT